MVIKFRFVDAMEPDTIGLLVDEPLVDIECRQCVAGRLFHRNRDETALISR